MPTSTTQYNVIHLDGVSYFGDEDGNWFDINDDELRPVDESLAIALAEVHHLRNALRRIESGVSALVAGYLSN